MAARTLAQRSQLTAWLYASPLVAVLIPFFVAPIIVVIIASFLENDGFGGMMPSLHAGKLRSDLQCGAHVAAVLEHHQVRRADLGGDPGHRVLDRVFPRLSRAQPAARDRVVPAVHCAVLDLEHHPHDLVDSAAREERSGQLGADVLGRDSSAARVSACSPTSPWWSLTCISSPSS